jgi:formate dehydrogenase maturation protein FdhE
MAWLDGCRPRPAAVPRGWNLELEDGEWRFGEGDGRRACAVCGAVGRWALPAVCVQRQSGRAGLRLCRCAVCHFAWWAWAGRVNGVNV